MVDQTQVKDETRSAPHGSLREGLNELADDLLALVELQFRLFSEDARGLIRGARTAVLLLVGAVVIAAASLPVGILGLAYLVARSGLHLWASMLLVAFVLLGLSAAAVVVGFYRLKSAVGLLRRSRRELQLNMAWMRRALSSHNGHRR